MPARASRRRKTPRTDIAERIRVYARGYAANGQKERAEGMLQAADLVDDLLSKGGFSASAGPNGLQFVTDLEARVTRLEGDMARLKGAASGKAAADSQVSEFERQPRVNGAARRSPREISETLAGDVALSTGEERILAAIVQLEKHGGRGVTNDELTAMVDYRETSLRTYLSNLRAAGYVVSHGGRHQSTAAGDSRVEEYVLLPAGAKLYSWWLGRLPAGEKKILSLVPTEGIDVGALVGGATNLRETSVRTYVASLMRRRLIVRPAKGKIALAPILTDSRTR